MRRCSGEAGEFNYNDAMNLPELMNQAGGYAGYTDWRLPTIEELRTLVFCSSGQPAAFNNDSRSCRGDYLRPRIVTEAFPNTPSSSFWSGSPHASHSNAAWDVYFYNGHAGYGSRSSSYRVRLVRGGQ